MAIEKWNNNLLYNRLSRIENIFTDFFDGDSYGMEKEVGTYSWSPSIDIKESNNSYTIVAEFPGCSKDDIDISLENNVLMIKGEKRVDEKKEDENFIHVERNYGSFSRSFKLPANVDTEKIQASFEDGVLYLEVKKSEVSRKKTISIK